MAQYWIAGTLKGEERALVTPSQVSWKSTGNVLDPGRGSFTIEVEDGDDRDLWDLTDPWRNTIVVTEGDRTMYAGVIIRAMLDVDSGSYQVETREVGIFLSLRLLFGVGQYPTGTKTFKGRSLRGTIIESIWIALSLGADRWNLPIVVPASEAGNLSHKYDRTDFATTAEWLEQIAGQDGGPEIDLYPMWTAGRLQWALQVGAPRLDEGTVDVNLNAPEKPLSGLMLGRDGGNQRTGIFAIGNGGGEAMIRGESGERLIRVGPPDLPYLDSTIPIKDTKTTREADSRALAELNRWIDGEQSTDFKWEYGGDVAPLRPHTTITLHGRVPGRKTPIDVAVRVLSVSSRGGTTQELELEEAW